MGEGWGGDNSNDTSLPSFNALAHSILWVGFPDTLLFEPLQFHINPQALHCSCWLWLICRCMYIPFAQNRRSNNYHHKPIVSKLRYRRWLLYDTYIPTSTIPGGQHFAPQQCTYIRHSPIGPHVRISPIRAYNMYYLLYNFHLFI